MYYSNHVVDIIQKAANPRIEKIAKKLPVVRGDLCGGITVVVVIAKSENTATNQPTQCCCCPCTLFRCMLTLNNISPIA